VFQLRISTLWHFPCNLVSYPDDDRNGDGNMSVMNNMWRTQFTYMRLLFLFRGLKYPFNARNILKTKFLNKRTVRKVKNVWVYNPRSCFILPYQSCGVFSSVDNYLVQVMQRTFHVVSVTGCDNVVNMLWTRPVSENDAQCLGMDEQMFMTLRDQGDPLSSQTHWSKSWTASFERIDIP